MEKLSGQLLLDTASRLPSVLKRRYLDYLAKMALDLNHPGFDSLREFITHELSVMTSHYAQTFFKNDEKDKPRDFKSVRDSFRVQQVAVKSKPTSLTLTGSSNKRESAVSDKNQCAYKRSPTRPHPNCFICIDSRSKHFLADCEKFANLSIDCKRQMIINAGRCLNCLSLGHRARDCAFSSKCRKCAPNFEHKHASVLHDLYKQSNSVNVGAAEVNRCRVLPEAGSGPVDETSDGEQAVVRKLKPNHDVVLLRTSAVRVINPDTGKSTLAYAQHDTASQATLISEGLKTELGLNTNKDKTITISTLAQQTTPSYGLTDFSMESLTTGETFRVRDALVVPDFTEDLNTLPHAVDTNGLEHFKGVEIPTIPQRKSIDILIGQTDKCLLTVIEEREGLNHDDPNYVLTRLGPIASGGRVSVKSYLRGTMKVGVDASCNVNECDRLKLEITSLKERLRNYELDDEIVQPSQNDELTRQLVEPHIKVVNERYEIPVPLKTDVVSSWSNNFTGALERTKSLPCKALKDPKLKLTLTETFQELVHEGWLVPLKDGTCDNRSWYLPFFVTKQNKTRVVFDGAATYGGVALNDAVFAGTNLLNDLVSVLIRFRLGKFACMADLSKCYFQISLPESQQDLFRLIWYTDNDLDRGEIQRYRFTRHVWGINSSAYIALLAIERLILENPTAASQLTLSMVENNRYMDDMLMTSESLTDLEMIARESMSLFESRGFKLRKWVANGLSKSILSNIPQSELGSSIREIDLGSHPMPDCRALGVVWDVENDCLKVCRNSALSEVSTRRKMLRMLASHFDPLGILAPFLLKGKLILQKVTLSGIGWDDDLPGDVKNDWKNWIRSMEAVADYSTPRYCFSDEVENTNGDKVIYQLHVL